MRLLANTVLVWAAIVLGFTLGAALGFPVWLQGFFLIPAMYLFSRLLGDRPPRFRKISALTLSTSAIVFIYMLVMPHLPEDYSWIRLVILIGLFALFSPFDRWIESKFSDESLSESEPSLSRAGEQVGARRPTTAPDSKSDGNEKPKPDSEARSQ